MQRRTVTIWDAENSVTEKGDAVADIPVLGDGDGTLVIGSSPSPLPTHGRGPL
jgi:hypothetical protein